MAGSVCESPAHVYPIVMVVGDGALDVPSGGYYPPAKTKSRPRQKIFEKSSKKFLTRAKRCGKLKKLLT